MWWVWVAVGAVVLVVIAREFHGLRASGVARVVPGRHRELAAELPRPDRAVVQDLTRVAAPATDASSRATTAAATGPRRGPDDHAGAVGGTLAATAGLVDWWTVDPRVLDAVEQWTHTSVDNGLDLWRTVHDRGYNFDSAGFERNLRGHVGEHEVEAQLSGWAGDRLYMPEASNNPGFDLRLDEHVANVKVGKDVSAIRDHLAEHPDIPVIVNSDMKGHLPDDALHLDLTKPFDPDLLADHSVIVADGLQLSDLQDALADAFGPSLDSFSTEDMLDGAADLGVPVLGTVVRVIRSGIRENKLREVHGDTARMWRNIGTDAAFVGGGVAGGGLLGTALGAGIDLLSGGATVGLGTMVIGPALGSLLGGWGGNQVAKAERMRPLTDARAATTGSVERYGQTVTDATDGATTTWTSVVVPRAQRSAQNTAERLKVAASHLTARARHDLERAEHLDATEREQLLNEALSAVDLAGRRVRGYVLAQRRLRDWRTAAAQARESSAGDLLDLVAAAPGGPQRIETHLATSARRRAVVLAAAGISAAQLQRQAEQERAALFHGLVAERDRLQDEIRDTVRPTLEDVANSTAAVRRELVATGARTQEWVDEHLPQPPTPETFSGTFSGKSGPAHS